MQVCSQGDDYEFEPMLPHSYLLCLTVSWTELSNHVVGVVIFSTPRRLRRAPPAIGLFVHITPTVLTGSTDVCNFDSLPAVGLFVHITPTVLTGSTDVCESH